MNNDCIFSSLLYLGNTGILNNLLTCKCASLINTKYLWKLLCERNYKSEYDKFNNKSYYDVYKLCTQLTILINKLTLKYTPYELYTIKELYYSQKSLMHLPNEICNLVNLQMLILSNNELVDIPIKICNLTNLQELYLDNNKLNSIPNEINQLTNLKILDLYNNKLTSVPMELSQMKNLKELNLENNNIKWIPTGLLKIKKFYI